VLLVEAGARRVIYQATQVPDKFVLPVDHRRQRQWGERRESPTAVSRTGMTAVLLDLQEEDRP